MPDAPVMTIGSRRVGAGEAAFLIAEIGINHEGDEQLCERMIHAAAAAGADAVKLQTVTPEESYHPDTDSYALFKTSVLSEESLCRLMEAARAAGVVLFSTPGDMPALALMESVGMPVIKISSGLLTNTPLIEAAAATGRPMILSTGMAYVSEVEAAVTAAGSGGCRAIAILQCTSLYPAPPSTLNLRAMQEMSRQFEVPVGYSDHHPGGLACVAAVAMGAAVIEKHFTLDATAAGADHAISLEPEDFASMVRDIRRVEEMQGRPEKGPVSEEAPLRDSRHRRLVAARDLLEGETLKAGDFYLMRLPDGTGVLPADRLSDVLGRTLLRGVARLEGLRPEDILEPS